MATKFRNLSIIGCENLMMEAHVTPMHRLIPTLTKKIQKNSNTKETKNKDKNFNSTSKKLLANVGKFKLMQHLITQKASSINSRNEIISIKHFPSLLSS